MSQNRFGYEWATYPQVIPLYREQFNAWTAPLNPADWRGKAVLDAGCGTGRNSMWPLEYGAARVVAFDVDPRTVGVAKRNLSTFPNCEVQQHSIYELPWQDEFDVSFSIGVIHHLADPRKAVAEMVKATRPGGVILLWVYGKEGHGALKWMVNAVRRVTCRMPPPLLNAVVYPFSFLWWAYLRLLPQRHPYLRQLHGAALWHVHTILFDQLLPEIANYWTRDEAMGLFDGLRVGGVQALWVNRGSWTVWARKET